MYMLSYHGAKGNRTFKTHSAIEDCKQDASVHAVVEFTSRFKADGKTFKTERYVWNNKDFGEPDKDALIEIIEVKVIRDGNLNTSVKGIIGVK